MNENIDNKYKTNQILLKIILYTEYISFICLVIHQMQAVTDFSYRLHEIMALPVNIAIFAVPLEIIVFIYYRIRWRIKIREEVTKKKYWRLKKLIFIFLVLIPIIYFNYIIW